MAIIPTLLAGNYEVYSYPDFSRETKVSCVVCHANPAGGPVLTYIGESYMERKKLPEGTKDAPDKMRAVYVGNAPCIKCHPEQHKYWKETSHARAFYLLLGKKAENVGDCLRCHTTGYNLLGGYQNKGKNNEALKNVNCENCHGPGSLHAASPQKGEEKKQLINTRVTKKMCTECHTKQWSPNFNLKRYLINGIHPLKELILE